MVGSLSGGQDSSREETLGLQKKMESGTLQFCQNLEKGMVRCIRATGLPTNLGGRVQMLGPSAKKLDRGR